MNRALLNSNIHAAFSAVSKDFPVSGYLQIYTLIQIEEICNALFRHIGSFSGKLLLDVGSGPMDKTAVFARLGFETYAADDLSDPWHQSPGVKDSILSFADRNGIKFHLQTPENYTIPFERGSFDVVTSIAVIEHLHDTPRIILNAMGEQLKTGGMLVVVMPNSVNLRKRLSVLRGKTNYNPLGELYFSIGGGYRGHVREYTLDETVQICQWSGFEIVEARHFEHLAQQKLGPASRAVFLSLGNIFPSFRSGLLVIGRKPEGWRPRSEDPQRYFEAIASGLPTPLKSSVIDHD